MNKKIKIFKNETNIYSGNCYVNTVIFRGRIYNEFKKASQGRDKVFAAIKQRKRARGRVG